MLLASLRCYYYFMKSTSFYDTRFVLLRTPPPQLARAHHSPRRRFTPGAAANIGLSPGEKHARDISEACRDDFDRPAAPASFSLA